MIRIAFGVLLAVLLFAAGAQAQDARTVWRVSNHTMGEALIAGFAVVDTFYTPKNELVFVLQPRAEVLLCVYNQQQTDPCTELGRE